MKIKLFLALCVVIAFATHQAFAAGTPVGVGGDPPSGPFEGTLAGVDIGSQQDPIEIWLDPSGGHWVKQIQVPTPNGVGPGIVIPVWEHIQILPPPPGLPLLPLTDWHEDVHTSNWSWAGGSLTIHNTNTTVQGVLGGPQGMNNQIWFEFPPHFPLPGAPLDLWIHKELQYNGPPDPSMTSVLIEIWEHPTVPEPTTLILMMIGSAGVLALPYRQMF